MSSRVRREGWRISSIGDSLEDRFLESVFFTGNGRMGARGYPAYRPVSRPIDAGLFIAGFYDRISDSTNLTDFVNLPTPIWAIIKLDGQKPALKSQVLRELDLSSGLLLFTYALKAGSNTVNIREQRFFSLSQPNMLFQRIEVRGSGSVEIVFGVDHESCNSPIPDDQVKSNSEVIQMTRYCSGSSGSNSITANYETHHTKLRLSQNLSFHCSGLQPSNTLLETGSYISTSCFGIASGKPLILDIAADIRTSRDNDPLLQMELAPNWSFDTAIAHNRTAWNKKWADCDVLIDGDDDAQTALRYIIYQLIANSSSRDDTVSIGARGLTHTRYKGCYFWDTDLFLTPFYNLTDPQAARSLISYRLNTLPQAKDHAKIMGGSGARFPWMTSYDGTEQCESWDIGSSEVHITADVAYAVGQYLEFTNDDALFFHGGAELLIETARFWMSRYSPAPEAGKVNLLFCKGPDEYCGITSNNLFTNMMVKHNLALALHAADRLSHEDPEQFRKLNLSAEEQSSWRSLSKAIKLPRDPGTGHYRQDDTFHLLEPVDPTLLKAGDNPSYHQVCFDRVQRYRVIKQADVLLLMTRLPKQFTSEEKQAAWHDFEPLCLHDSTLSFASHALFAAQNDLTEDAERYWKKALYLDLDDIMKNTGKEGLHMACLGEVWQTVIFGFAGLHFDAGAPKLKPKLPTDWRSLRFRFTYHGKQYTATISSAGSYID